MKKCLICKRVVEEKKICPRCASIIKDFVIGAAVFVIVGAYIISPIDLVPEAIIGPLGLSDDVASLLFILGFEIYSVAKIVRKCL